MLVSHATRPHRHLRPQKLQQLRQKSSVPGPLEARRRAAKRKYADSASSPLIRPNTNDISLLFGSGLGVTESSAPKACPPPQLTGVSRADPRLPSWLTGALRELQLEQDEISSEKLEQWKKNLKSCQTTHDIELLGKSTNIQLRDSRVSRLAFEHLCKVQGSVEELFLFLNNKDVNPPAALNLAFLFSESCLELGFERHGESWLRTIAAQLPGWLKNEIFTGNLTEQEIRHVARWVAVSEMPVSQTVKISRFRVMSAIARGVLEARIRPPHHLQRSTIRCILRALTSLRHLETQKYVSYIASNIIKTASKGSSAHITLYNETYLRSFLRRYNNKVQFQHAWKTLTSTTGVLDRHNFLTLVGFASTAGTPTKAKAWLSYCLSQPEIIPYLPASTWKELPELHPIIAQSSPSTIYAHLNALGPSAGFEFVLDYLVLSQFESFPQDYFTWNKGSYATPEALKEALRDYIKAHSTPAGLTPYLELFRVIKSVSPRLSENIADQLLKIFANASTPATLALLTQYARSQNIVLNPRTAALIVKHIAPEYPLQALDLFLNEPRLRVENCLSLVAAIIATPAIPNETILSLVSRTVYDIRNNPGNARETEKIPQGLVLALTEMLSKSDCTATAKLGLVSRVLELFDPLCGPGTVYMMRYALHGEVIGPFSRGESPSITARRKVLKRVAKREGDHVSQKLGAIIAAWESMAAPLEGRFEPRESAPRS